MRSAVIKTFVALLIAAAPLGVHAQEAIPTAPGGPAGFPPLAPPTDAPLRLSDHVDGGPGFLRPLGPCGVPINKEDGTKDKSPHGEVYAGVGTHGYREIGGVVCMPVGDKSAVTIAVDAGQFDGWGRRR